MPLHIILDTVALLLLVIFAVRGAKRGVVPMVSSLLVTALALVGAFLCVTFFTSPVQDAVEPHVLAAVEELFEDEARASEKEEREPFGGGASLFGISMAPLIESADAAVGGAVEAARDAAVGAVSTALAGTLSRFIVGIAAFLIILIVLKIILFFVDRVLNLPGLNVLNRFGGFAVGLLLGGLIVCVIAVVVTTFDGLIPAATVNRSVLFQLFYEYNPLGGLIG